MALDFTLAGSQIDGAREYQEDAFLITNLTDSNGNPAAFIIIADGMGGHAAGNVASNMAVQAFNKHVTSNYPTENPAGILYECVLKANNSIAETIMETPALSGMGCTMVAAILDSEKLWWASVGDSHLYLVRGNERKKMNADHSYGGFLDKMAAEGTPINAEPGLSRNMLMSAVSGDEINDIDVSESPLDLQLGDRIVLCSDGIDTLSEGKFMQFSDSSDNSKACIEALLKSVEDADMPKQDNTTIVVVDVIERTGAHVPAPPPATQAQPEPEPPPPEPPEPSPPESPEPPPPEPEEIILGGPSEPPPPIPTPEPMTVVAPQIAVQKKKSGINMTTGIAAVVVIGIAIAGYMILGIEEITVPRLILTPDTAETETNTGAVEEPSTTVSDNDVVVVESPDQTEVPAPAEVVESTTETASITPSEFSDRLRNGSTGPDMVVIPAANFEMGSSGATTANEERPRRTVSVKNFAISKYEITFTQYERFASATRRSIPNNLGLDKSTFPVIFVTWDDAFNYTRWLSDQTGENYSLPTESQWEYAAGTGATSSHWWGYNEEPNIAQCFGCGSEFEPREPAKVGSFSPNKFGVHDTAGNVSEWVADCWHENYNNAPSTDEVWEGGDCSLRVVRGGAYSSPFLSIRHAKRDKFRADSIYDNIGFRVVRSIQ